MSEKIVLGLEFGSDSVRTLVVSCADGTEIASAVANYPRWSEGRYSDRLLNQFRHHPLDYIGSMSTSVREALTGLSGCINVTCCGSSSLNLFTQNRSLENGF